MSHLLGYLKSAATMETFYMMQMDHAMDLWNYIQEFEDSTGIAGV